MGPGMGAMGCECSAEDKPNRSCALSCATDHTEDLKMVIMVHRHGARHPTKQLGGDLCWPANKQFWESYKAQLTPTGAIQHNRLGKLLRQRNAGLFADLKPEEINNNVKVHASNYEQYINLSIESKLKEIEDAEKKMRKEFKSRGDRAVAANDFEFMNTQAYTDYVKTAFDKARGAEDTLDQEAFEAGFETILTDLFKASQFIGSRTKVDVSKDDAAKWFKLVEDAGEGAGKNDGKVSLEEFKTLIDFCVVSTKLQQLEGLSADLSVRPTFRRYQKTPFIMGNDCEIGYGFELTNGGPNQNGHLLCSHPFDIKTGEVHVSLEYYTKQIHADKERGEGLCVYLADPAVAKVCEEFEGSGVCGFAGKTGGICGIFFDLAGHISGKDEVCVRGAQESDAILAKTKVDKGLWSNEKFVQIHIKFDTVDKKIDVVLGPIDGGHKVLDNVDYPFDLPKKIIAGVCAGASGDNYSKICVNKLKLKSPAD